MRTADPLELCGPEDRFQDYCLWDYDPLTSTEGKMRSINLLRHSFDVTGVSQGMYRIVDDLRTKLGPWLTVWGLKLMNGRIGWEYYFYDYDRLERYTSLTRVLEILAPNAPSDLVPEEKRPYFMFSLDLDEDLVTGRRTLDEAHIYVGNVGSTVSSGLCYTQTRDHLRFDNLYCFFDAKTEMEAIIGKIACSAHLDLPVDLSPLMFDELKDCGVIVVANKKNNEGIYYSRINVHQLISFMRRLDYPDPLVSFIESHRDRLDHMLYDVGLDYVLENGAIRVLKSGYYGVF